MNSAEELYQNGTLRDMLNKRMITPTTYRNVEILIEVKNQEMKGVKRTRAVAIIASTIPGKAKIETKKRAVWAALKSFGATKKR